MLLFNVYLCSQFDLTRIKNWKDAVRSSIQLSYSGKSTTAGSTQHGGGRRNLMSAISEKSEVATDAAMEDVNNSQESNNSSDRRLTRSALTRTLLEREQGMAALLNDGESSMLPSGVDAVKRRISVFDIRGLARLRETFSAIDNSVKEVGRKESREGNGNGTLNILLPTDVCYLPLFCCMIDDMSPSHILLLNFLQLMQSMAMHVSCC